VTTCALAIAAAVLSSIPGVPGVPSTGATSATATATDCALTASLGAVVPTATCLTCHSEHANASHPVDLDYASVAYRSNDRLRPLAEVVRRGLFLPDGRLECVTCHDGRSPWAAKIALPPGAPALAAVNPSRRDTYEGRVNWRTATASSVPALPRGSAVTPTPLCAACHALAD
jgi:hypothetical protein